MPGELLANISQLQVGTDHCQMRFQASLAKGFERRSIHAVGADHQVNTRIICPAAPLRLFDVREHLLFQHPRPFLDHLRQPGGFGGFIASRFHRISSCTFENYPIHLMRQHCIAVVPEIELVFLRLQYLAPDVHIVTLDTADFTTAHPDKVHDFRHGFAYSSKQVRRR
ncbi:hypothetical protein SRM1_00668 [Pseudomonas fluorescens]|nr:hypothetical protein SRM1_00668 [Pseudomonas fluorescens]